jgi:DNA-binding CsgD family transcriptional regulator
VFPIGQLSLPPEVSDSRTVRFEDIERAESVHLFVDRVRAVRPDFHLTRLNAETVASICRRLEGIPLALELSAARADVLSLSAMLDRLDRQLPLLVGGPRDAPLRHQTQRGTIGWSYDLLGASAQETFRRLSVFADGFTLEAAEAMGIMGEQETTIDAIATLIDASLLHVRVQDHGGARYTMLDTVREFGIEQLVVLDELPDAAKAHARYFEGFVRLTEPNLYAGRDLPTWLQGLDDEQANLRAALTWSAIHDAALMASLVGGLSQYWLRRSMLKEGRMWSERLLGTSAGQTAGRAAALADLARMMTYQKDPEVIRVHEEAYAWAATEGDLYTQITIRAGQAVAALIRADPGEANWFLQEALRLSGSGPGVSGPGRMSTLQALEGFIAMELDDLDRAEAICVQSIEASAMRGDRGIPALAHRGIAGVAMRRGNAGLALIHHQRALSFYWEMGERWTLAVVLFELGIVMSTSDPETTARLYGASARLRNLLGVPEPDSGYTEFYRTRDVAIEAIGNDRWQAAWNVGLRMPTDEAVSFAMNLTIDLPSKVNQSQAESVPYIASNTRHVTWQGGLTRRELEVLALLVEGLSSKEIAESLRISYRTTTTYITSIFTKLNVSSRTAAATFAIREGLV